MTMITKRGRRAFTLIELLVVVAVILILFSISMKIMALANRKTGITRTTWVIEQVKNALGAFYAEYGAYPPVNSIQYKWLDDPSVMNTYSNVSDWGTTTGLVFFLKYIDNSGKWSHYIDPVLGGINKNTNSVAYGGGFGHTTVFTNNTRTIYDAWGKEIHYSCSSADGYQGYRLWSSGPNGSNDPSGANEGGGGDDIGVFTGE